MQHSVGRHLSWCGNILMCVMLVTLGQPACTADIFGFALKKPAQRKLVVTKCTHSAAAILFQCQCMANAMPVDSVKALRFTHHCLLRS